MRKKILLMLSAFCFMGATVFGQAIEGGAGIIHVDGDPNMNTSLNTVTVNEGNVAYDKDTQTAYYYDPNGTDTDGVTPGLGTHWIAVNVSNLVDPITSILTPEPELNAVTVGGVTTITFDSNAAITFNNTTNVLTFTNVDGETSTVDFTTVTDLVAISNGDPSITVSGDGSAGNPFLISLTGANGATAGTVPVTNGTGTLTWTNVVEDVTVTTDGQIQLTMTDGTTANLNLDSAPKVANKTQLDAEIAALTVLAGVSGTVETGIAIAAENNTFGMPADSDFGVIFFIKSN